MTGLGLSPLGASSLGIGYGGTVADQVWLDYSLARPTDTQLTGANTFGVCRYLSVVNSLTTKKIIWQAEYDHLLDLGIAIHLNYEWYEGRMAEGNAAGQLDGTTALSQAKALGYPRGLPITFSDDTSGTPLAAIEDYLTGVKTGLSGYYRIGYYGPRAKMDAVLTSGHAVFGWQPTAWAGLDANGQPIRSKLAHLFQYFGGAPIAGTDLNTVLREPPFHWYAGGPDMPLTDDEIHRIAVAVRDIKYTDPLDPDPATNQIPWNDFEQGHRVALRRDIPKQITVVDDKVDAMGAKLEALPAQIAAAVIAALPANPGGGATPAEVEQAVIDALSGAPLIPKVT
jgi:hypothetical protein